MSILEVNDITKLYNGVNGVKNISFTIDEKGVYGFLGPNGAGKSTTMNIMTGCLAATSGTVKIGDFDIYKDPVYAKMMLGYLPEQPPLYMERTPREYLNFVAEAKGIVKSERKAHIEEVMARTQITDVADRLIKYLSKGYKQRVGIAQAIIGDPELIILDEPTVGLDPNQILEIRKLIKELGKDHTVILSSHILQEVNAVCDKIIIIVKGKLIAIDTPENLAKKFAGDSRIYLTVQASKDECKKILDDVNNRNIISNIISNIQIRENDGKCQISMGYVSETDEVLKDLFFAFANSKKAILEMTNKQASLEEIFYELTNSEDGTAIIGQDSNKSDENGEDKS